LWHIDDLQDVVNNQILLPRYLSINAGLIKYLLSVLPFKSTPS
jgi:hypothetical protein